MPSRTITTDATTRYEGEPDRAIIKAVAIGEGKSARAARAVAADGVSTIRESLAETPTEQVRTRELQVQDTDMMFDPITDAPFQASQRLRIDCLPKNAESVIIAVLDAGGRIQSAQFELRAEKRRDLQNKAIRSAMERAREKAEQIAAAEGCAVAGVQEATTDEVDTEFESIVDQAIGADCETNLHPVPIKISAAVNVVYKLVEE